ncbi:MAG: VOC family protein [Balneolaceae bacterium]|nr:VOC family protein [Balneolaceae bacterium]MBO6546465.1 VOC family protein [Balneolaceae bacterium]MBO6648824.1 VOC family protein [Balneolaceae bacterium]
MGFKIQNFDSWVKYLREKQVSFRGDVVNDPISGKKMVVVLDPDGNRIQFFEY